MRVVRLFCVSSLLFVIPHFTDTNTQQHAQPNAGLNIVAAATEAKVQFAVASTLDDVEEASAGSLVSDTHTTTHTHTHLDTHTHPHTHPRAHRPSAPPPLHKQGETRACVEEIRTSDCACATSYTQTHTHTHTHTRTHTQTREYRHAHTRTHAHT